MRARLRDWIGGDFVARDEFEAVKAIAIAAREKPKPSGRGSMRSRPRGIA